MEWLEWRLNDPTSDVLAIRITAEELERTEQPLIPEESGPQTSGLLVAKLTTCDGMEQYRTNGEAEH
jgi:hypothetical protein